MAIAKPIVIIDGCNAINLMEAFADNAAAKSAKKNFQASCSKLISIIQNFSCYAPRRFIIVFDGYSPRGQNQYYGDCVSVVFSGRKIADLLIEKMTLERNAKTIEVVTSDNEVADICRNHGAKITKIHEFERQLEFYGRQADCHLIKQKGGKVSGPNNPLEDNLDEESAEKLNQLAVLLQKKEMEAKAEKEAEIKAANENKRKIKQDEAAGAKKPVAGAKTIITDDDASLFTEMFAGAKRIESKKYARDDNQSKPDDKKSGKPDAKKTDGGDKNNAGRNGSVSGETFDWRQHIDESFEKFSKKR